MSVLGGYLNGTVTGSYCHRRLVVTTAIFKMELTMELQWSVITGWRVPCRAQSLIAPAIGTCVWETIECKLRAHMKAGTTWDDTIIHR